MLTLQRLLRTGLVLGLLLTIGACASGRDDLDAARGGAGVVYERARKAR